MKIQLVDLARQFETIEGELRSAINQVLRRCDFVMGEDVARFEEEFAAFCGARFAVGVSSGTDALMLALRALGIGPGCEVITVPFTFAATVEAILTVGAHPIFVDINPDTGVLDPRQLERKLTSRTKAILPVHLYGFPCDWEAISDFAQNHGLLLIEDASQAHGAEFQGRRVGSLGHAAAFSFYPGKNLGAYGEAGAVVTSDPRVLERVRLMRNHGSPDKYRHTMLGWNLRLDSLQAAVLRVKLRHLTEWNARRRCVAEMYTRTLSGVEGIRLPVPCAYGREVFHFYVVRSEQRDQIQNELKAKAIASGIHYPIPLHLQDAFAELGYRAGDFPASEAWAQEVISLPTFPELREDEITEVVECIKQSLRPSKCIN